MTSALKITQIGNSLGVILPREMLTRLKLEKGDMVFATDTPDGVLLTSHDPAVEEQLELGRDFMQGFRDTFHQLSK